MESFRRIAKIKLNKSKQPARLSVGSAGTDETIRKILGGIIMKIIINSDNKMRNIWCDLVQAEKGDKVRVDNAEMGKSFFITAKGGEYFIRRQSNTSNARISHEEITQEKAKKIMSCANIDDAYEMMNY